MHEYNLICAKRKTMTLHIKPDATIEVRAPLRTPRAVIDNFVESKEDWINSKLALLRERKVNKALFALNYGDIVWLCGKKCAITARSSNRVGYDEDNFYIPLYLSSEQVKNACIGIYKLAAKEILVGRTAAFAERMRVKPASVKISSAKTRWGSCNARKSINYSWRLIMADNDVIDYVVVHELAHLIELNHSDKFWAIVSGILPDYKTCQGKLKSLHRRLDREDWD